MNYTPALSSFNLGLVVTSKGRANVLARTLPRLVSQSAAAVVLVDYDCPDGSGLIGESLGCEVVRISNAPHFHLAHARNLGAKAAANLGCDLLGFIDADTLVADDFVSVVLSLTQPGQFLCFPKLPRPARWRRLLGQPRAGAFEGLGGCLVVPTTDFVAVGGYDEWYQGYGREAVDMRLKLYFHGLKPTFLPFGLARHLPHGGRTRFYATSAKESTRRNEEYLLSKVRQWRSETGLPLPVDLWPRLARQPGV